MDYNIKSLWGKFITILREEKYISLYVACGDINNPELYENTIIINTIDQNLYNKLTENLSILNEIAKKINPILQIQINKLENENEKIKQDLIKLKSIFKDKLTIH